MFPRSKPAAFHSLLRIPRSTGCRAFCSTTSLRDYASTIANLKIGPNTRVIFQGFTGRQATSNAKQSIEWGTRIVGGVTPGKEGEHLDLPVLPTVRKAMEQLRPDATGIYVAAHQAPGAIEEAIEAEVPLIVAVAEHIPLHDILRIHDMLKTQSKSRLVGANSPGIVSAIGRCRIGFQPLPMYSPGHVGVIAKSGTLSYETVGALTRAGLGQSLCIGMGGDVLAGTDFVDGLKVLENDEDTEAIILVGEVGGTAEEEAAEWIEEYRKKSSKPKPIAALIGGMCAKPGRVMGHAGAWAAPGESSAEAKYKALESAGATMVGHPSKFGTVLKRVLAESGRNVQKIEKSAAQQRRGYHTFRTRPIYQPSARPSLAISQQTTSRSQRRGLHLPADQASDLLKYHNITVSSSPSDSTDSHLLVVTVDRTSRSPCIIASPTTKSPQMHQRSKKIAFSYSKGPSQKTVSSALAALQLDAAPPTAKAATASLIETLFTIFKSQEAISLSVNLSIPPSSDKLEISNPAFSFDDAAFRSTKRQADLHALRDTSLEDPVEVSAEKDGIVYIKLDDSSPSSPATIGTLVNGAGLAMNTIDALTPYGGHCANFLDTGGKATSATVKRSFELILSDPRIKVVFVNIFGGLTLCDMIAEGVILAFKELSVSVPVVVRLRGTNEKEGQKIIAESGLKLEAFDGFDEAARRVVELAAR